MHGVEQVAAIDAQIVETLGIEVEELIEGQALDSLGAGFGKPCDDDTNRTEGSGGT